MDERFLKPKVIVFDIGGVLLRWDPLYISERLLPKEHFQPLYDALYTGDFEWARFDRGLEDNESIARDIAGKAGVENGEKEILYLLEHFHLHLQPLPLSQLITPLREQGKKVYLLTNYPQPSFDLARQQFPFLNEADGWVCSADEREAKPGERIFHIMCERYHFIPEDALFVDDSLPNIETAARLGFHVWHYLTPPRGNE